MNVLTMEDTAFWALVKEVVKEVRAQHKEPDLWISGDEAMDMLRITSKTTLQKLRDTDAIKFSQPFPKLILYNRQSILDYIEKHVKKPF